MPRNIYILKNNSFIFQTAQKCSNIEISAFKKKANDVGSGAKTCIELDNH